jgi:hypothetical protein
LALARFRHNLKQVCLFIYKHRITIMMMMRKEEVEVVAHLEEVALETQTEMLFAKLRTSSRIFSLVRISVPTAK